MVRFPRRFVTLGTIFLCVLLTGGAIWFRVHANNSFFDPHSLLSRFPVEDALVFSADVSSIRRSGLLTESKTAPEPEYRQFLDGTGFDYRRDLDSVLASSSQSGTFFIARGRFDWKKLRDYTARQGGACYQDLCRMQGSTPERHISFLPLRSDTIALAVSTDDLAASRLTKASARVAASLPSAPVWLSVPGTALRGQNALPPTLHLMLSALTAADRVVVTLGPGTSGTQQIVAELDANCRTDDDAKVLASQLRSTTSLLKEAVARDKAISNDSLALMLTAGTFSQANRRVTGIWPMQKSLIASLTEGL